MKKFITLAMISFLLTGCTVVRINTHSIDNTMDVVLSKDNELYNRVGRGYKYYVPRGVTYIDTSELNEKLYSDGNNFYLYIDAISYYYEKKIEYTVNEDAYYSRKIDINGKEGYLEINLVNKLYLIEFMYNYAKIEALVDKKEINLVVLNASYILSTVKFNNNVISLMLDEDYFTNREEKYDIFTPKTKVDTNLYKPLETLPEGSY
jgi:hypothetical protein